MSEVLKIDDKDIVRKQAFQVLKNDMLSLLKKTESGNDVASVFGMGVNTKEFLTANDFKNFLTILAALTAPSKSEKIKIILQNSESIEEFTLKLLLLSHLNEEMP